MSNELTDTHASMQEDYLMAARIAEGYRPDTCPSMVMPLAGLLYTQGKAKDAEIEALRQQAHDICMSRSLSLSKDGKHAEANEAQKCASAVMYAKLGAAYNNPVTPEESEKLKVALTDVFGWVIHD